MSRPTVTVVSAKGEATKDTVPVPNVFKVSSTAAIPNPRYDAAGQATTGKTEREATTTDLEVKIEEEGIKKRISACTEPGYSKTLH